MKTRSVKALGAAFAAVALLLGAALFRAADHSPSYRFQEAIDLMETKGDYPAAIRVFEELAKGADRNLAARSLLYVGLCYEKLGKDEARKAYERVVRECADQSEAATEARARLAALSGNGGSKASEMVTRRVWAGPDVDTLGSASPDGRYLSYVDWSTGDLAIRDLTTGENHRLTHKGSWSASVEQALVSVVSPDAKRVTYSWLNKDYFYDLRVVGLDGSGPRILYSNPEVQDAEPADWSPDGKYILANFSKLDRTNQIVLVSVADGSVRVLKTLDWRFAEKMGFSPDGRFIAYDFPPDQNSESRDIFLLSLDGSREVPVVQDPANDRLLGWTPDGNRVLFASDRTGSMSVWSVQVANGEPEGAPELVKADVGEIASLGLTRKGAFYYGVEIGKSDVYVATLDVPTGRLLTAPSPVTQRYVGSNSSPFWSADGQYLAFTSERRPGFRGYESRVIVIRSVRTGKERELAPKLSYFGLGPWSPDGRSFIVSGADRKRRPGLYHVDAQTGRVAAVVQSEPGGYPGRAEWSPDGKTLFYERYQTGRKEPSSIVARDLQTGHEMEVVRSVAISRIGGWALSPDGSRLALSLLEGAPLTSVLKVVPTAGGEPKELLREELLQTVSDVETWTPDGKGVIFSKGALTPQQPKVELWRISADGGKPEKIGLSMDGLGGMRLHPDGKRVAFSAGVSRSEVWVMENFLPVLKATR